MRRSFTDPRSERGAVLVQVAVALVALIGFSTFVVDYGVMWTARRQAQNAADAAALAAAVSTGFVDPDDEDLARQSALAAAAQNLVWGEAPDVTAADVTFPTCPPGFPADRPEPCVRVDVFRNDRAGGNPLPTFFGALVGVAEQGVRATATAKVLFGDATDCVKPFAVVDKWQERRNDRGAAGWSDEDSFEGYTSSGGVAVPLSPSDYYERPGAPGGKYGPGGTGFSREATAFGGSDAGSYMVLKRADTATAITPGSYLPVTINPLEGAGDATYRANIASCDPTIVSPGQVLQAEPSDLASATRQELQSLIALDPDADWDPNLHGPGKGGIRGGCMATGQCTLSPRLIAVPMLNPAIYDAGRVLGRTDITVTRVVGFFLDKHLHGDDVGGWLASYPSAPRGQSSTPGSSFLVSIALVR